MKWMDYREKLGLGFKSYQKFGMLRNNIVTYLCHSSDVADVFSYSQYDLTAFLIMIGKPYHGENIHNTLTQVFTDCRSTEDLISVYVAFCNSYRQTTPSHSNEYYVKFLKKMLSDMSIQYDVVEDEDGLFVFPKGAKELDDSLVSEPLEWLNSYPKAHSAFVKALKEYAEATDETASETADKFRKALETFFQEYFSSNKTLENLNKGKANEKDIKGELGKYLKKKGVPSELSNDVANNLQSYTDFMNNYAKHHDKTSKKVLEYIMYQTGNIIRLLITLKQEE